jgi:hypothetical protein
MRSAISSLVATVTLGNLLNRTAGTSLCVGGLVQEPGLREPGPFHGSKRPYCPGGGPTISAPYRRPMAAIRSISASSGGASGWGGKVSSLAG